MDTAPVSRSFFGVLACEAYEIGLLASAVGKGVDPTHESDTDETNIDGGLFVHNPSGRWLLITVEVVEYLFRFVKECFIVEGFDPDVAEAGRATVIL